MPDLTFTNLTRATEIGANCYELRFGDRRLILDSGMHPRQEGSSALPDFSLVPDDSVEAVVLSHAHQDHIGSLPALLRRHPRALVFMTEPTAVLGDVMLHNSVNVMIRKGEEGGLANLAFTHREVDQSGKRWRSIPLRQRFDPTGERLRPDEEADISLEFFDAGHILGSTGTLLRVAGQKILYTGDVNFEDQSIMQGASFPDEPIDTIIVETTRGDHETAPDFSRRQEAQRFGLALQAALAHGGSVFIPLFALGKTQETLAMLYDFVRDGVIRETPIYIGGLSTKLTEIYDKLSSSTRRQRVGEKLLDSEALFTLAGPEAFAAKIKPGRIYALSSGMMSENTLSNGLARQVLGHPEHSIFFVGYADPESPAGRLQQAKPGDLFQLHPSFPPQELRCKVERFSFSGHATRESIRAYVNKVAPKTIILVHGDPAAVGWFEEALGKDLPASRIIRPLPGQAINLGN